MRRLLNLYKFSEASTPESRCKDIQQLIINNKAWSERVLKNYPDFFPTLSKQQSPKFLWIGCVDSRVSPERLTGMLPGELFVQRNVGNQVIHTDLNCLSVVQYAVEVLKVKHIIVCGHYNCSSIKVGLINNWILHIRDYYLKHQRYLDHFEGNIKWDKLCEINTVEQVFNLGNSTIIQNAWQKGQLVYIHGWVYGIQDGMIRDLKMSSCTLNELQINYKNYLSCLQEKAEEAKECAEKKQQQQ